MPGNRNGPGWEPRAVSEDCNGDSSLADGLDRAIEKAATDWWTQGAMVAISQLARSGRGFDVDDVLDLVGQPEVANYCGAAFASARRQKLLRLLALGSVVAAAWCASGGESHHD